MSAERFAAAADEYHASEGISHSMLEVFIDSPKEYFRRYVDLVRKRVEPTEEQEFGALVHAHLLERKVMPIPDDVLARNGAKSGAKWREFAEQHASYHLVKRSVWERLQAIEEAVREHGKAATLLFSEGESEVNLRWQDNATGLTLRCRIDRLPKAVNCIVDVKTCANAGERKFASDAERFGYHRQVAWYQDGFEEWTGDPIPPFVFIAIEKADPFRVEAYEFEPEWIERGRWENRDALAALRECYESGVWFSQTAKHIIRLKAPAWANS